jgi:hypothetical protein
VNDLTEVVNTISEITSLPDYINNDNDQSVVEICITRVTSAIRYVALCALFLVIQILTVSYKDFYSFNRVLGYAERA